jgi:hypothetical protein
MDPFNACTMTIPVLERIGILALTRGEKRLHPLSGMQGQGAPRGPCTGRPTGADFTIAQRKHHLDE